MNGKPLQYSCLENSNNSMKRQKDITPEDDSPQVGRCVYAHTSIKYVVTIKEDFFCKDIKIQLKSHCIRKTMFSCVYNHIFKHIYI